MATLRLMSATLKGGPGKTTTAVLLAVGLARVGLRVVVVCADNRTRGATDWVQEAERLGDVVPFRLAIWHETDGPLSAFAGRVEGEHQADVVLIDTGGEQPEAFAHGCMYAHWLICPVGPMDGELRRVVETYRNAAAIRDNGSPLQISVLLARCPQAGKGKAKQARADLTADRTDSSGHVDPDTPYALGLHVFDTEITRSVAYDEFYGTIPDDIGEYAALAEEIRTTAGSTAGEGNR